MSYQRIIQTDTLNNNNTAYLSTCMTQGIISLQNNMQIQTTVKY